MRRKTSARLRAIFSWTYCLKGSDRRAIADVTAFGIYAGVWFPAVPHWIWVLSVVLIILRHQPDERQGVRRAGVLVLLSFFKVATIIIMIVAGIGSIIVWGSGSGGQPTGIHNLWVTAASSAMAGWE